MNNRSKNLLFGGVILFFIGFSLPIKAWSNPNRAEEFLRENFPDSNLGIGDLPSIVNDRSRNRAYGLLWSDIVHTDDLSRKRRMVEVFVGGVDDEAASSFVVPRLASQVIEAESFSDRSREVLLNSDTLERRPTLLRAVGIAGISLNRPELAGILSDAEPEIEKIKLNAPGGLSKWSQFSFGWAALLVRARAGDEVAINDFFEIMGTVSRDELVDHPNLLNDMAYIRHPEAVDMLVEFVMDGDGTYHARTGDDYGVISLEYRAAKALSFALEGFPIAPSDPNDPSVYPNNMEEIKEYLRNYEGPWRIRGKWKPEEDIREEQSAAFAANEIEEVVPAADQENEQPEQIVHEESRAEAAPEKPSLIWPWMLGALILLGGLGLVLARKKSSTES